MSEEIFKRLKAIIDEYGPVNSWCNKDDSGCEKCIWQYIPPFIVDRTECVLDNISDWVGDHE